MSALGWRRSIFNLKEDAQWGRGREQHVTGGNRQNWTTRGGITLLVTLRFVELVGKEYNMSSLIDIIAKVMKPLLLFANLIFLLVSLTT